MSGYQKPKVTFNYQNNANIQLNSAPNYSNQIPQMQQSNNISQQYFQQNQINEQNICICPPYFQPQNDVNGITLLNKKQQDNQKKVAAIIVSFCNGCTYDGLFTSVEQKSQEGTKVQVYSCSSSFISSILKGIKGEAVQNETLKQLLNQMKQVDPDCVVFNWQCSSGYGNETFSQGQKQIYQLIKWAIDNGHMTMFSDFSLKALIKTWKAEVLGPNPFVKISQTSQPFTLKFRAQDLAQCPSAQLQIVGEMADGGKCHVQAMASTIVYTVDQHAPKTQAYKLQVLTVVQNNNIPKQNWKCKIGDLTGSAGHCLLTFKSGGHMLTSMGHWIELMKIDTSEKKLFEVAQKQYGAQYAQRMKMQYTSMNAQDQREYVSKNAVNFVQNQAPCANMYSKSMKKY